MEMRPFLIRALDLDGAEITVVANRLEGHSGLVIQTTTTDDPQYRNVFVRDVAVDVRDNDEAEVVVLLDLGPIRVFDTALGSIAVAICYDSEFPLLVRAMAEAGAEIVLVPSCTERVSGFHRVATGAKARALENTIVTVQSPTVGDAPWSPAVDRNCGKAAIYVPSEHGVSDDGVVAEGVLDRPMWVAGTVDLDRLRRLRTGGEMRNYADWSAQPGAVALGGRIERQSLVG